VPLRYGGVPRQVCNISVSMVKALFGLNQHDASSSIGPSTKISLTPRSASPQLRQLAAPWWWHADGDLDARLLT
jgi:hypothetical protein